MLHLQNLPNPETQIPRYKFKLNQNLNLNLYARYREIAVSRFGGFLGCSNVSGNCDMCMCERQPSQVAATLQVYVSVGWEGGELYI